MEINKQELRNGIESKFWRYMVENMMETIGIIHYEMEDTDGSLTIDKFKALAAEAKAYRRIIQLPNVLLQEEEDAEN